MTRYWACRRFRASRSSLMSLLSCSGTSGLFRGDPCARLGGRLAGEPRDRMKLKVGSVNPLRFGVEAPRREPPIQHVIDRVPSRRRPECPPFEYGFFQERLLVLGVERTDPDRSCSMVAHGSSVPQPASGVSTILGPASRGES